MAIKLNLPNFLGAPIQKGVYDELIPALKEGYLAGRVPAMQRMQERHAALANQLAEHKARYYPQVQEQALRKGNIDEQTAQLNLNALPEQIQQQKLAADIANRTNEGALKWQDPLNQSLIDERNKKPQYAPTNEEKNLNLYKNASPADQEFLANVLNIPHGDVPKNAIPLRGMETSERLNYRKLQDADIEKATAAQDAADIAGKMLKIVKAHPGMSEWVTTALQDPENKSGWKEQMAKRLGSDKKAIGQIEIFNKYAADLQLQQGRLYGGAKGATDSLRELIAQSKTSAKNTDEAKIEVLNSIIKKSEPWIKYGKEARTARNKGTYAVLFDPYQYQESEGGDVSGASTEELMKIAGIG